MADTESKVDSTIGGLANLSNAPDDALVVLEYLGKAYNSTMGQLKAALGAITGFAKTAGDSTPGTNDVYTITFGNGGKLDITIPIPKNGENGYTPQKGKDYFDGYTPQKGKDYFDGYTPQKGVDYNDGFSPTVEVKQVSDGVEITITDATGPHTAKLKNPRDGVSPSFRVDEIEGGYRVYLSSAHEHQQFDLLNGESGDWNVNNPTWKGFIKGRTHWKEEYGVDGVVIEETSVTFSGTTQFQTISGIMSEAIQVGGKYTVTYNGVDYACIGKYYDGAYIGNGSFMNADVGNEEDTGEPFCIQLFGGDFYMLWKADKTKETVTVKVVGKKETVWHKLDGGYLPEGVPYSEGVQLVELLPETTMEINPDEGPGEFASVVPLAEGQSYTVKYNGVEYACVCTAVPEDGVTIYVLGNIGAMMGSGDTGEPFIFMSIPAEGQCGLYALDGSTSVTLSISSAVEKLHKMDGKLLSEGTPYMQPFDDVILEETVLTDALVETSIGVGYNLPIGAIIPGNIYNVEFDGVVYRTKAYSVTMGEITAIALGSGCIHGGSTTVPGVPFTGDPFTIQIYPATIQQAYGFNVTIMWDYGFGPEESGTQTIAIRGGYTVNKIDNHCLPDGAAPLWVTLTAPSDGDTYEADISINEVIAALKAKMSVYVLAKDEDEFNVFSGPMAARVSVGHLFFSVGDYNFVWDNTGTITKSKTT